MFLVITNSDTHVKMALADWRYTSTISINDPVLIMDVPAGLAAATGMDAITQLSQDVGIPASLAELGAKEKDFELMAWKCNERYL